MKKTISIIIIVIICIFSFLIFNNYKKDIKVEVISDDHEETTYEQIDLASKTYEINTDIPPRIGYLSHPFSDPRGNFYTYYLEDVKTMYNNMKTQENVINIDNNTLYYNNNAIGKLCEDCILGIQDSFYDYQEDDVIYPHIEDDDIDNYIVFSLNKRKVYNVGGGEYIDYGGQASIFQYEDKIYLYINDEADIVFELIEI